MFLHALLSPLHQFALAAEDCPVVALVDLSLSPLKRLEYLLLVQILVLLQSLQLLLELAAHACCYHVGDVDVGLVVLSADEGLQPSFDMGMWSARVELFLKLLQVQAILVPEAFALVFGEAVGTGLFLDLRFDFNL